MISTRCGRSNSLIATLFSLSCYHFLIRTVPLFIECSRYNAVLTAAHARTKQLGGIQHSGPHSTETSAEEWARNCCLARIIREPLNTSTFCFGTGCSTSGANKSHANKTVPAPRAANFGGDPSWRSQFLRSRANIGARRPMARAARVKTRVRILLKSTTAGESERAGFFCTRPQCLSSTAAYARSN